MLFKYGEKYYKICVFQHSDSQRRKIQTFEYFWEFSKKIEITKSGPQMGMFDEEKNVSKNCHATVPLGREGWNMWTEEKVEILEGEMGDFIWQLYDSQLK